MYHPKFPLRISYPDSRPYASPKGSTVERVGGRVIVTYADLEELRECIRLHRLIQEIEQMKPIELEVSTKELM